MAEKRMIAKSIVDSDAFLDMPVTARLLYFDLNIRADDDGFVNSPKKIMRITGASQDDLTILALKKFIIPFENGVIVIKHWRVHNYIRKDTYTETNYQDQKAMLELDKKGIYHLRQYGETQHLEGAVTEPSRSCDEIVAQTSIDEISIDQSSKEKNNEKKQKVKFAEYVSMEQKEYDALVDRLGEQFTRKCIEKLDNYKGASKKKYASDYRAILSWVVEEIEKKYPNLKKKENTRKEDMNELDLLMMGGEQ